MKYSQITEWCHEIIRTQAKREGLYIDATMGKGADTAFLCELAGEQGHVIAFDIQEVALDYTKKRLENENLIGRAELILDGHEHMARYAGEKTVDLICFNFGYLPGQNHAEIDTISYPQKCRKSAVSGRCFYFWHCGSIGRTAPLPERIALFKGTL